jgi:hypothetical protein
VDANERGAQALGDLFDVAGRRCHAALEHRDLEPRSVQPMQPQLGTRHRLNNPVDVARATSGVRPQGHVDLVGRRHLGCAAGRVAQERPELTGLRIIELGNMHDVPLRLHHECAKAERADAVLDEPQ